MEIDEVYNYLIETNIVSDEALNLITNINGYSIDTLNDVIYCTTGYRDIEQYLQYEDLDTYNEYFNNNKED